MVEYITNYVQFLKRRNYSRHTLKNYSAVLSNFSAWINSPLEQVTQRELFEYIDHLWERKLKPRTINSYLNGIRGFYNYLDQVEEKEVENPAKKDYSLRLPKPLPRYLKNEEITVLFKEIQNRRDRAMFLLMLRSGLRVEELSKLTLDAIDFGRQRIAVCNGKWQRGRIVYFSDDALKALVNYLRIRPTSKAKRVFLAQKLPYRGKPLSVRGIQKRMEYYARKTGLDVSCHQLRHTMATQLLNADARLTTVRDLLGHSTIRSTQRYCKVSNVKVQRDYFKAMERVVRRMNV
jgi:site-specific recombinase XerD